MKTKMVYTQARIIAGRLIKELSPYCQRLEIAGSLRRKKPEVGDIELIAIPKFGVDLFGNVTEEHLLDSVDWERFGKVIKAGHKYKQIELYQGINLDLFIVTPPAQFGVQFVIRTGPADFSKRFVTSKKFGGLLPSVFRVQDGAIWSNNHVIETPEEADVFHVIGLPFIEPEKRS